MTDFAKGLWLGVVCMGLVSMCLHRALCSEMEQASHAACHQWLQAGHKAKWKIQPELERTPYFE